MYCLAYDTTIRRHQVIVSSFHYRLKYLTTQFLSDFSVANYTSFLFSRRDYFHRIANCWDIWRMEKDNFMLEFNLMQNLNMKISERGNGFDNIFFINWYYIILMKICTTLLLSYNVAWTLHFSLTSLIKQLRISTRNQESFYLKF